MAGRLRSFARLFEVAVRNFYADNCPGAAASLAFYGIFSGFPLLLLAVIVSTLVLEPERAARRVQEVLAEYVPVGSGLIERAIEGAVSRGGAAVGFSVVALLWSGSRVFGAAARAINTAWKAENYSVKTRFALEPLLVALGVLVLSIAILYEPLAADAWSAVAGGTSRLPEGAAWTLAGQAWRKAVALLLVLMLYRYLPRRQVRWREALLGAVLATLLFQLSEELFRAYVTSFDERYSQVYGPLSSVAVMLIWAYITAAIFLLGAEFSAAFRKREERRTEHEQEARMVRKLEELSR
jgi:membrane protein